jgi:hypothetical protein
MALRHGQSAAYIRWKRNRKQGEIHHVFGSMFSRKSTDYLTVSLGHEQHMETHSDRDQIILLMPDAVNDLIEYVKFLEAKIKEKGSNETIQTEQGRIAQ